MSAILWGCVTAAIFISGFFFHGDEGFGLWVVVLSLSAGMFLSSLLVFPQMMKKEKPESPFDLPPDSPLGLSPETMRERFQRGYVFPNADVKEERR